MRNSFKHNNLGKVIININLKNYAMKKLIVVLFIVGLTTQTFAQDPIQLSEVIVVATNYKYLNSVSSEEEAIPVQLLQREVATYDVRKSEYYDDEYDFYTISFFIPDGKIVAVYDKDNKIVRTIEKFKDIALPKSVAKSVAKRFPQWTISKDVYLLRYHKEKDVKKIYKLTLENGDQRLKVKTDSEGNFL